MGPIFSRTRCFIFVAKDTDIQRGQETSPRSLSEAVTESPAWAGLSAAPDFSHGHRKSISPEASRQRAQNPARLRLPPTLYECIFQQ